MKKYIFSFVIFQFLALPCTVKSQYDPHVAFDDISIPPSSELFSYDPIFHSLYNYSWTRLLNSVFNTRNY